MFLNPEQVIKSAGVQLGNQVADFGSGSGFYTIPLAQAVGPRGKIYALDVQQHNLDLTRGKAREARLMNVSVMKADLERPGGSMLAEGVIDFVFVSNILFQAQDKPGLLKEAARILKSGGKLVLIDWSLARGGGPRPDMLVGREEAEKLLEGAGLKREREFNTGDNHYGLLYQKP